MGGIGVTGFLLIALVALLLFGPNKLPELGRAFGRTLKEFKAGARDIMDDDHQDRKESKRVEVSRSEDRGEDKRLPE
ncbi:twin-arginine translocase TatA/TatE family subunit [Paenibacillus sacheonensis]|uniref:Sec-independent protein translocase protein TatA n=1 Tax=Paenibacillus sacheonensis TaxID=742054 RepID=A0A7X4YPF6_9BACL|nr:twin-arginine translocase TatA/TatE family subunit [Paenibacillus sacheonensis]MBM7565175.1 sec-independent protein translocase protein TatA [Paenibacillus sacheonensis]NBC70045.1 twin-arginine translocase TatA/TatE family subunit [Paenibacillus sacheonensis]